MSDHRKNRNSNRQQEAKKLTSLNRSATQSLLNSITISWQLARQLTKLLAITLVLFLAEFLTGSAFASEAASGAAGTSTESSLPHNWQMGIGKVFSPMGQRLVDFHNLLLIIITAIVIIVVALMAYILIRYNAKRNKVPSDLTHSTPLEIVWTVIPVLILMVIAIPSMQLLYYIDRVPNAEMTLKVTAHQWNWSYEIPDAKVAFDSNYDEKGEPRKLAVDKPLVLPINTNIRVLVTSTDVIHSWYLPKLGVQIYATPGRTNETWLNISQEGTYYGQCNQICGAYHGQMPIMIKGVSKEQYAAWLSTVKN